MPCDVCIGGDVDFPPSVYHAEMRKARTAHKCGECNRVIAVGEQYEHVRAVWEGHAGTVDTCGLCVEIRNVFTCGEGFNHHELWNRMAEDAFPQLTTASECFTELSASAKAFVLERWREWKFE